MCNGCNLLFTAFAWPGAIKQQSRRKRKTNERVAESVNAKQPAKETIAPAVKVETAAIDEPGAAASVVEESVIAAAAPSARETAKPPHRSRKHAKTSAKSMAQRKANATDYARFGFYYSGLYVKNVLGIHKASHPLEVKYRWRNWWHLERSKAK